MKSRLSHLIFSSALTIGSAFGLSNAHAQTEPVPAGQNPSQSNSPTSFQTPPQTSPALQPNAATPTPAAAPPKTERPRDTTVSITKVVGEVGAQVITSREVKINSAVEQAFREKPTYPDKGFQIPDPQERAFSGEVSRVLDEWAVFFEAKSLDSQVASKSEVSRVISLVQDRWGKNGDWVDLEVSTDELRLMIERKVVAEEFQKLKSDPALSPISDDEALAYYKKNRLRFGTLPFASFKDNIKAFLVKSQIERRLSEWHEVLRRKYKTRNFISG